MVIIKGTVTFQAGAGGAGSCKEYSDLEVMQMLGRAGRPQFDDSAIAIIMTRSHRVKHYEKMISGEEVLESRLHLNLFDHLNAEIGLGTITSASSAKQWLSGTFLYVRLKDNPEHYNFDGDVPGKDLDERLETICTKGIAMLEKNNLVTSSPKLHCTEFGDVMARYYVQFDTMKMFLAVPPQAKISEILSSISQAVEFKDIRFRGNEKMLYKTLNKNSSIKFPIPVNLEGTPHKVSLVIQSVLGAIELPTEDPKHRVEYNSAKHTIFQHVHRLIRCIIDCKICLKDAVSTRNALMLARSFGAQVWDDSPLHMKQLEGVGLVGVRKLVAAGIKSIEDIENAEGHRLEAILSRNPPFGSRLLERARAFPKVRVSLKAIGQPLIKKGECVTVKIKSEIGFLNLQVPEMFQRRPIYVCLLAETSDGKQVHFARISAKKLNKGQNVLFSVDLTSPTMSIRAYVMCDEIAGSARHAVLQPEIPTGAFPPPKAAQEIELNTKFNAPNISKRRASALAVENDSGDEFEDADIGDADLVLAETGEFVDIDDLDVSDSLADKNGQKKRKTTHQTQSNIDWEPHQFANGNWACNHACKDKTSCKHFCCREGLDKKPKPPKQRKPKKAMVEGASDPRQTQLSLSAKKSSGLSEGQVPKHQKTAVANRTAFNDSHEVREPNRPHDCVQTKPPKVPIISKDHSSPVKSHSNIASGRSGLSFLAETTSSDYELDALDMTDLPSPSDFVGDAQSPILTKSTIGSHHNMVASRLPRAGFAGSREPQHSVGLAEYSGDLRGDFTSYAAGLGGQQEDELLHFQEFLEDDPDHASASAAPQTIIPAGDDLSLDNSQKEALFLHTSSSSEGLQPVFPPQNPCQPEDLSRNRHIDAQPDGFSLHQSADVASGSSAAAAPPYAAPVDDHVAAEAEQKNIDLEKWFDAKFGRDLFELVG